MNVSSKLKLEDAVARTLFDHAPVAMLMIDRAGTVELANSAAEQLFGYSREILLGKPVELLVAPSEPPVPALPRELERDEPVRELSAHEAGLVRHGDALVAVEDEAQQGRSRPLRPDDEDGPADARAL